jgi:hypothetical protein
MDLKAKFNSIPNPIKWFVGVGLVVILAILLVFKGQQVWNGIGNKIFEWKIGKKQEEVNKDLADAARQKVLLEQSLKELKAAKEELTAAKAETDRLKGIFDDSSKNSAQKVAEFKKAVSDNPVHTPTDNVTTEDLCARAKAIGSSPGTIAAVCGQ